MQTLQVRGNDVVSGHTQGFYHFKVQDVGAVMVNVVADGADSRLSTCTLANSRSWTTQRSSCGSGKKHRRLGFQGRRLPQECLFLRHQRVYSCLFRDRPSSWRPGSLCLQRRISVRRPRQVFHWCYSVKRSCH
ncbi:Hypothetical protein conserved in the Yarrowia clade [Yarrowia lipolytica]|nr:Hypothetical protein conserved in the Yarrowia clade [Yarrowia lipolytica]